MTYYIVKVIVSALVIVAVSEIAKRSTLFGALIASIPFTTVLAMIWLYRDTGDSARIAQLSTGVFWLVLPSLVLLVVLPLLLRAGWSFWLALGAGTVATVIAYGAMWWLLRRFGVAV